MELCLIQLTRKTISDRAEGRVQTGEFDQHRLLGLFLYKALGICFFGSGRELI